MSKGEMVVNVKDFGATGDGVSDDTKAIQRAINQGINRIYIPKGVYIITSPLIVTEYGYTIFGAGINNTILKATEYMDSILMLHEGNSGNSGVGRLTLSDIEMNCNKKAKDGIFAKNLRYNNVIERLRIVNALRNGINLAENCWINNINQCQIMDSGDSAVFIGGYGNAIHLSNNDFNKGLYGVKVDARATPSDGVTLIQNTIQGFLNAGVCGVGMVGSLAMIGNYFEDNEITTIDLGSSVRGAVINGNKIHGKTGVSNYNIVNRSRNASIIGNTFYKAVIANINNIGNTQSFVAGNRIENGSDVLITGFTDSFVVEPVYGMPSKFNGKRIGYSGYTSPPTTGTWEKADFVYNSNPDSGKYVGWICIVSGTPGIWRGFGLIQNE